MPYYRALTRDAVTEIKSHAVSIYPWTVDEPEDMRELIELGVDGMLTNRPDRLKEVIKSLEIQT